MNDRNFEGWKFKKLRNINYPEELMEELKYKVIYSGRRSISIIVSPDKGVTVRAPYRTSLKTIEKFVRDKSPWIRKHLDNHSDLTRISHGKKYFDGETHLFMGIEKTLKIIISDKMYIKYNDNIIEAGVKESGDTRLIKTMLEIWYKKKAIEILPDLLYQVISRYRNYNFNPKGLVIRSLRSRWGSCNSKGKITLNTQLIKLDKYYIEYVIIHELCHLIHHNHGEEFYRLLGELVPDYKTLRKELKKYITG